MHTCILAADLSALPCVCYCAEGWLMHCFCEGVAGITSYMCSGGPAAEAPAQCCRCTGEGMLRQLKFTCSEPCALPRESTEHCVRAPDFSEETLRFSERGAGGRGGGLRTGLPPRSWNTSSSPPDVQVICDRTLGILLFLARFPYSYAVVIC